jgi:hypothetical protein
LKFLTYEKHEADVPENPGSIQLPHVFPLEIRQYFSAVRVFVAKKVGYKKTYDMPKKWSIPNPFVLIGWKPECPCSICHFSVITQEISRNRSF